MAIAHSDNLPTPSGCQLHPRATIARCRRWSLAIGLMMMVLQLPGCVSFLSGECGAETRETEARGEIRDDAGSRIGRIGLTLLEVDGAEDPQRLLFSFMGPAYGDPGPLATHVTGVRLLTSGGGVVRELQFAPGNQHEFIRVVTESVRDRMEFDALRRALMVNGLQMELGTDIAGRETITVPLPLVHAGGWSRASCS